MDKEKKKGLAALIVDRIGEAPGVESEEDSELEEEESSASDEELIAGDILAAIESGDVKEVASSLKSFIKACSYESGEGEED